MSITSRVFHGKMKKKTHIHGRAHVNRCLVVSVLLKFQLHRLKVPSRKRFNGQAKTTDLSFWLMEYEQNKNNFEKKKQVLFLIYF